MNDIYGHLCGMPFARWDHDTQSWRTSEDTSLLDLPMSSLTLPKSGGMRNGQLLQRQTLALPIYENASSSLRTLPTPLADKSAGYAQPHTAFPSLANEILNLLPTPTVNDMGAGKDPQKWQEWTEEMRQKHGNGNGHGRSLEQEAVTLLPTPRVGGQNSDRGVGSRDDTNLYAIFQRMAVNGNSTSQPSDDGNTSSDDQHQTPQLWEEQGDPG
jgi:DNA (cytosine-5)-methyltransferase 1